MNLLRPVVGSILLVLGVLSVPYALAESGANAIQLWVFTGAYLISGALVLGRNELGAWGAILVPGVTLAIIGAQVFQAGSEVEIPLQSWITLAANVVALVGGVLLVRGDDRSPQGA